jgi:hypothetical protein
MDPEMPSYGSNIKELTEDLTFNSYLRNECSTQILKKSNDENLFIKAFTIASILLLYLVQRDFDTLNQSPNSPLDVTTFFFNNATQTVN